jgi:hypothetical protein
VDDKLGDDGEADDPEVEEDIPEIVLKSCRILEPEYKEVSSYVDTTQKQNLSGFFHKSRNLLKIYCILSCIVCTFFRENYAQILPAHYIWKVPEKFFFCQKSF